MKKMMVALTLALATTTVALAQGSTLSQKAIQNKETKAKHFYSKMSGSIAFTGIFARQWTRNQPNTEFRNLAGWGVMPALNIWKGIGFQGDVQSMYTTNVYPSINKLSFMAGPRYTIHPYWSHIRYVNRARAFGFGEAGETRTTYGRYWGQPNPYSATADWNPTASAGLGIDVPITRHVSAEVIPGEWMGERFDSDKKWQNNYEARAGFVINLP